MVLDIATITSLIKTAGSGRGKDRSLAFVAKFRNFQLVSFATVISCGCPLAAAEAKKQNSFAGHIITRNKSLTWLL